MMFPGQGSQMIGMLKQLAEIYSLVEGTFEEAADVLKYDLWNLVQRGPIEELSKTWRAQPAILAASISIWRIWKQQGGKNPELMAGHSLGEYSALVCSGVINFVDAIQLVELRGRLMQEAVPIGCGAMAAIIGLDDNIVLSACIQEKRDQIVSISSFNASDQVVISGHKEAVQRVMIICKKLGAKKIFLLPISVPSHCELMRSIAIKLANNLNKVNFCVPKIPVVNNVDVYIEQNPIYIRRALIRQLYQPVRWMDILRYLIHQGVDVLLELGPGKILTSLAKRSFDSLFVLSINNPEALSKSITHNYY
ncbi:ACP S-malonyltransferase [Blochmannia endosymbiont of Colobopsis nipponica]|uniref:ACP S-malonyltransferase n=1 Tax=Blochmannia endosymbiont of Colobopsis nipponica TaxID=2681987 RepID=UPI001781CEFB|nr:ACP S-malonyltransferase [Blochmannia endosymbiont of Colobopsis nipponica]QOI11299.1 ACP S-malonyltransferase [Blochmannia endosymbiont of Colobopsis nipponica]